MHYLLEAGWKADTAIQGLGRSNRTNQKQPPVFRPVTTDVRGEKRFLSTIARRLDTLGAITRGHRQTGGQGLLRAEDNLEGPPASAALRQFYQLIFAGKVEGCSLGCFEDATGLELSDGDGSLRETLPAVTTFLNRLLALPIALQNRLFGVFEDLLCTRIEGAITAGTYDRGVETVAAESLVVTERHTVYTHPGSGAETRIFKVARKDRNKPLSLDEVLSLAGDPRCRLLVNRQSGRAAVQVPAPASMRDDGSVEARVRLIRPLARETLTVDALERSQWEAVEQASFAHHWTAEVTNIPAFSESTFFVVTGLLLPIWTRLPSDEGLRVYRLQTDAGERVIGRLLSAGAVGAVCRNLGVGNGPALSSTDAWHAVFGKGAVLHLADGLALRRTRAMGAMRVELTGFGDGAIGRLKAMGLVSEIVSWKLRLFVPVGDDGPAILAAILDRHPLVEVGSRQAA